MEKLLSVTEIAELSGKHEETVRRWIREGTFEGIKKGPNNMSLIPETSVLNFLSLDQSQSKKLIDHLKSINVLSSSVWVLSVGQIYTFDELKSITNCPTIRGIRYRNGSPELSVITSLNEAIATSQYNPYKDRFENGRLFYTGEGQKGDQKLTAGNLKLYEAQISSHPVHVFQKLKVDHYMFLGVFVVVGHHIEKQPDADQNVRDTYVFELKPLTNHSSNTYTLEIKDNSSNNNSLLDTLNMLQKQLKNEKISRENLANRYKRSKKLVNTLKELYQFECQLCDPKNPIPIIPMENGRNYVEVHHIEGFAEVLGDVTEQDLGDFVVDSYNNAICCCAHHHRVLHHYRSKMKFDKTNMSFIAEDGSLTLPIYTRHNWHTFEQ